MAVVEISLIAEIVDDGMMLSRSSLGPRSREERSADRGDECDAPR
jgi:hypothetical protein